MRDDLEMIYAENTLPHFLSGKVVDRVIRENQMVDIALHTTLLEDIIGPTDIHSDSIKQLLQEVLKDNLDVSNITYPKVLKMTQQKLNQKLSAFTSNHTVKLWIQYLHFNDQLQQHLKAERLGNWKLHLDSLYQMLIILQHVVITTAPNLCGCICNK